jgi:hypothetical protein
MKQNKKFLRVCQQIGSNLIAKNNELKIKQKRDRFGNFYWQVYDYATNKIHEFGSEQDVKIWIENRHYFWSNRLY